MFLRAKECLTSTDSLIDTLLNISQSRTPFSPFMTSERLKRPSNWSFILSVQSLSKKLTFCLSQNENELEIKNSEWKAENPKLGYMISRFVVSPVPLGTAQNLRLHCVWTQTAGVLKKNKENWTELCSLSYFKTFPCMIAHQVWWERRPRAREKQVVRYILMSLCRKKLRICLTATIISGAKFHILLDGPEL